MKKSGYQIMISILNNYNPTKLEKEDINSFFFCRWLSGNPRSIFIGNFINRYYNDLPKDIQYDFSKMILNGNIRFIKQTKKIKDNEIVLNNICKYYKINRIESLEYLNLMQPEEKEKFEKLYNGA